MLLRLLLLGIPLGCWALPSHAGQTDADFNVTVALQKTTPANTGACSSNPGVGVFAATVTVVCTTGAAEPTGKGFPYRFMTGVSNANKSGMVDSDTGMGTSTAFNNMVGSAGQDYMEMTIAW